MHLNRLNIETNSCCCCTTHMLHAIIVFIGTADLTCCIRHSKINTACAFVSSWRVKHTLNLHQHSIKTSYRPGFPNLQFSIVTGCCYQREYVGDDCKIYKRSTFATARKHPHAGNWPYRDLLSGIGFTSSAAFLSTMSALYLNRIFNSRCTNETLQFLSSSSAFRSLLLEFVGMSELRIFNKNLIGSMFDSITL